MDADLKNTLILSACFLGLFLSSELIYHQLKVKAEYTRKFVHIGTGLLTMLFPVLLSNHWWVLLLCSGFLLLLLGSLRFNFLKSINAVGRFTLGSVMYPVAVYLSFFSYSLHQTAHDPKPYIWFYLPVLIMALADPAAALAGRKWPLGPYKIGSDNKSWMGSLVFVLVAFIVYVVLYSLLMNHVAGTIPFIVTGMLLASVTAFTEAFSSKGMDNLSIPVSAIIVMEFSNRLFHIFSQPGNV